MSLTFIAEVNLGVLMPSTLSVITSIVAELTTEVTGLVGLSANMVATPPSFALSITGITSLVASITAAISEGVVSVDCQLSAVGAAQVAIAAQLAPWLALQSLLGGDAGIFSFAYAGTGAAFGGAVTEAIGTAWPDGTSSAASSNALVLGVVAPSAWTAMQSVFAIPPVLQPGLTYIGNMNIGVLCPIVQTSIFGPIAALQARLSGLAALSAKLTISPPDFLTSLALAADLLVVLANAISIGLPGPAFQISAIAKAVSAITARVSFLTALLSALAVGGVFVYTYAGPGSGLGPALTTELAGGWRDGTAPTAPSNALVLGTVSSSVWTTMLTFFGGA